MTAVAETLEDLLGSLGNVRADRVLLQPTPGSATEADLVAALGRPRPRLCELVDGTLVEKAASMRTSAVAAVVLGTLGEHATANRLGVVVGTGVLFRIPGGNVRIAEASFLRWERFPGGVLPEGPILDAVPSFVVLLRSPRNTAEEVARRSDEFQAAGTRLVWLIDTDSGAAEVHRPDEAPLSVAATETLSAEPIVPGFSLSLPYLASRLRRPGT